MTVYLIHFNQRIGNPDNRRAQASHYIGYAFDLHDRLARHAQGAGSHLMRAVKERGIDYQVVRTWHGGRRLERKLKDQKNAHRMCPVCLSLRLELDVQ